MKKHSKSLQKIYQIGPLYIVRTKRGARMIEKVKSECVMNEIEEIKENHEWMCRYLNDVIQKSLPGTLKISRKHKTVQYFYITESGDKTGKYIKRDNLKFAKAIQQKNYAKKLLQVIQKNLRAISYFEKMYTPNAALIVYNQFAEYRKDLIIPLTFPDEMYVQQWLKVRYKGNSYVAQRSFSMNFEGLLCSSGNNSKNTQVMMRSKSEVIIATILIQNKVPFRYEFPITMDDGRKIYPDFYCLNARTRQEFVWEHLGKMDDVDYASKNVKKLNDYMAAGFYPGKNLIITMETELFSLDTEVIDKMVKKILSD